MPKAQLTLLPHRALVRVSGDDRIGFLQNLVSNDMTRVQSGEAVWAALLTPQGKFLHEFFAVALHDAVLLECERTRRDDLATRLARFKLRAKVSIAGDDTLTVGVAWGEDASSLLKTSDKPGHVTPHGAGVLYTDPRHHGAGVRFALQADQHVGLAESSLEAFDAWRIALGLPDGSRDMEVDKALLLENGFEELHGVDFNKGCYIGQELTARTHYRALIKKRLMPVTIDGPVPPPGTPLATADGSDAGELKSASGNQGLALLRLDKLDGDIRAGSTRITPQPPAWMKKPG